MSDVSGNCKPEKTITFRVDNKGWIRVCEIIHDKILIRANRFGKPCVVNDTARDKSQQLDAEGFVRIRGKRSYSI